MEFLKTNGYLLAPLLAVVIIAACAQNTPDAVFNRGLRAYQERDFLGASIYFEEFIEKFPKDERILEAHVTLADCFMRIKDYASARAVYEDMKERFDDPHIDFSSDIGIGQTYFQEGFMDEAVAKFQEVASATDNVRYQLEAYRWLGRTHAQASQTEKALEAFNKIAQIAEEQVDDSTTMLHLKLESIASKAEVYQASKMFDKARQMHLSVLDLVGDATETPNVDQIRQNALISWAHTYRAAGDCVSAATIYDQLHDNPYIGDDVKPNLIMFKLQCLRQLFLENEEDEYTPDERAALVKEWQRITKNFPNHENAIVAHVEIADLVRDSSPELFEEHFQKAIARLDQYIQEPDNVQRPIWAMLNKARVYSQFERFDKAKQSLEQLMQSYSQVPQAVQPAEQMLNFINRMEAQAQQASAAGAQEEPEALEVEPRPGAAGLEPQSETLELQKNQ